MAKSWADLNKEEREATGMTKAEYNRSTGYRAEVIAAEQAPAKPTPTPTPTPTSQQEAVERSQSWEDLSRKDKKAEKAAGETKKSFNQSTGYRAEEIAIQKQDADPENTKYSELSLIHISEPTRPY